MPDSHEEFERQEPGEGQPLQDAGAMSPDELEAGSVSADATVAPRTRRSMFADPVVRALAIVSAALVVLFLAGVVGLLSTGLLAPQGPRTLTEKELATARAAVSAGTTDTAMWGQYVAALVSAGQESRARSVLAEAREKLDDSTTGEFHLAEARIFMSEEDYEAAIKSAQSAMEQIQAKYDEGVAKGGLAGDRQKVAGLHDNYYISALIIAKASEGLGDWDAAIAHYDIYIAKFRGAADILVDRGNAKLEAGDAKGAKKDFEEALRFFPDSIEAREALDTIGATE